MVYEAYDIAPRLTEHLQTYVVLGDVPTWMTKEKTTLIQKNPQKGNTANNYRRIVCLQLMWKLMTCALAEKVYTNLSEKNVLLDEQK